MDPLLTCIPLGETIDFTHDEICIQKKLEPFCKKSVSKKLWNELCKGCTFLADGRFMIQVEGYPVGGLISVVFSNKFCVKMKPDVVRPSKPNSYKCYVDIDSKWIKNQREKCFKKLNNYHLDIKFTTEVNPCKFLGMEIMIKNCIIEASVAINESKIPTGH